MHPDPLLGKHPPALRLEVLSRTWLWVVEMLIWLPSEVLHSVRIYTARPVVLLALHRTEHCLVPIHVELLCVTVPPELLKIFMLFPRIRVLRVLRPVNRSIRRWGQPPAICHRSISTVHWLSVRRGTRRH